jgi:hypothetical protein
MRKYYNNIPAILNSHQGNFLGVFFRINDNGIESIARSIMRVLPADCSVIVDAFLLRMAVYGLNDRQGTWFLDWIFDARYEEVDDNLADC